MGVTTLDIFFAIAYSVSMEERLVRQIEQKDIQEEIAILPNVPAPMVERTFRLLELLSTSEDGLTLSDLSRALHASKGSVHGLLKTLESNNVIEQGEERRFVLGPRIYDLAQAYIQRTGLRHFALPAMRRLAASTGETVCLGKVEQKGVRIIECIVDEEKPAALHIAAPRGLRIPFLAAATGVCILASWSLEEREAFLHTHPLPRFTERSPTDPQQFLLRVEETSRTGIGFDREEYLDGVNAVAASIYGPGGTLVALLWIVGFTSRWSDLKQAAQQLSSEAVAVSRALGVIPA
jgi:IclR family KDG regulon transcriptional repressor